jgi:hypothetical protein
MRKYTILIILFFIILSFNKSIIAQKITPKNSKKTILKTRQDSLKELSNVQVKELETWLKRISDKSKDEKLRKKLIPSALTLFSKNGEKTIVEINSKNILKPIIKKTGEYLYKLSKLEYSAVEIKFAILKYVSEFKRGKDGRYYGTVSIEQTFIGHSKSPEFKDYHDITTKDIEIVAELRNIFDGVKFTKEWKIFFGDIKVTDTK